ncbi:MAG: hypothetical protein E7Z82_00230 [Methanobrevibacter sp.]|uniref:hypothetical protein n=1 Tax=unclassified Methanobrevibacter TaxID=2638681 RepID=UPI001E073D37|nr:hypothetical protein [Methanobrevibacter sp. UBA188]MBE6491347.1 hypothetical protein [Methanobrevibacter sp.]
MKLFILSADSSEEIKKISEELSEKKFIMIESEDNFALMKKRRYGNLLIQVVCLILALQVSMLFLFINLAYFAYSYLWASPHVLITTEKVGEDGEKLEFDSMDDVLNKANAIL